MASTSSYGDQRSRVSYDRVELEQPPLDDPNFELSRPVEQANTEVRSVSWIYDRTTDAVIWASPAETFFGFAEGTEGFYVTNGDVPDRPRLDGHRTMAILSAVPPTTSDPGAELLEPVLAAIRAG